MTEPNAAELRPVVTNYSGQTLWEVVLTHPWDILGVNWPGSSLATQGVRGIPNPRNIVGEGI